MRLTCPYCREGIDSRPKQVVSRAHCNLHATGPVAQWIRHRPTEPGIAGSSPAGVIFSAAAHTEPQAARAEGLASCWGAWRVCWDARSGYWEPKRQQDTCIPAEPVRRSRNACMPWEVGWAAAVERVAAWWNLLLQSILALHACILVFGCAGRTGLKAPSH